MCAEGRGEGAAFGDRVEADNFGGAVGAGELDGNEAGGTEAGEADATAGDAAEAGELLEGDFDAHSEFERGDVGCSERGRNFEQILGARDVELGVAALRAAAGVAPDGDACADLERRHAKPERHDFADRFVSRLAGQVGIFELLAGEHGVSAENVQIPVGTGSHGTDAHEDFARTGRGHGGGFPHGAAGGFDAEQFHPRGNGHRET